MKRLIFATSACLCLVFASCKKKEKNINLIVTMKDDPADYQQVNIDVKGMEVHTNGGWTSLPVNEGVYNLLDLQGGVTAVLVDGVTLPAGSMQQMRLILGSNNTLMIDSTLVPLATPSAQQSGLKINVNHDFEGGETYELLLDFVAGESVVEQGNGDYSLKPVLRIASIEEL